MWRKQREGETINKNYLFTETFLATSDDEHIVEEDEIHFHRFSRVKQIQWAFKDDLSSRSDDQVFARLFRDSCLQELQRDKTRY